MDRISRLKMFFRSFKRNKLVLDVSSVGVGIAVAQAINLLFAPILSRIFDPSAFGSLGAFTALAGIITAFATFGYSGAIVLASSDEEAKATAQLALIGASVVGAGVGVLLLMMSLTGLPNPCPQYCSDISYLLPLNIICSAIFGVATQWAIREAAFREKSRAHIEGTIASNCLKLGLGLFSPTAIVLVSTYTVGLALNSLLIIKRAIKMRFAKDVANFSIEEMKFAARKYSDFPLYRMPHSVLNATAMNLPVILLTSFFGTDTSGQFALATMALSAPAMLLGQSVSEVFSQRISSAIRNESTKVSPLILRGTVWLGIVASLVYLPVLLLGPEIFKAVFGNSWGQAGEYSRWMAIWSVSSLMNRACVSAIPALGLQKTLLAYEIVITLCRISAMIAGAVYWRSDIVAIALFSIINVIGNSVLVIYVGRYAFKRDYVRSRAQIY